eukprot:Lithocolla_globosa_v1_NODE_5432_length_1240_cov_4.337553.p2 type:complete len:152 gc:universal NODE_5432_length_1240_cov_4.337553:660-1115(+)
MHTGKNCVVVGVYAFLCVEKQRHVTRGVTIKAKRDAIERSLQLSDGHRIFLEVDMAADGGGGLHLWGGVALQAVHVEGCERKVVCEFGKEEGIRACCTKVVAAHHKMRPVVQPAPPTCCNLPAFILQQVMVRLTGKISHFVLFCSFGNLKK